MFGPILSIQQEECLQKRTDSRDVTYSAMPDTSPRKRPSSRGTLLEAEMAIAFPDGNVTSDSPYCSLADLVVLHHLDLFELLVAGSVAAQNHGVSRGEALEVQLSWHSCMQSKHTKQIL